MANPACSSADLTRRIPYTTITARWPRSSINSMLVRGGNGGGTSRAWLMTTSRRHDHVPPSVLQRIAQLQRRRRAHDQRWIDPGSSSPTTGTQRCGISATPRSKSSWCARRMSVGLGGDDSVCSIRRPFRNDRGPAFGGRRVCGAQSSPAAGRVFGQVRWIGYARRPAPR